MRTNTLFIVLLFISIASVYPSSGMKFYNSNDIYGTSTREAYSICKDDNGFIWCATKTGVVRISESDSRIYSLPYEKMTIFFTRLTFNNSQLVAYTNNGQVFLYNEVYDRFDLLVNLPEQLKDPFLSIASRLIIDENTKNTFWIGTSNGIYLYKDSKATLVSKEKTEILYVSPFSERKLFISTSNGIGFFDLLNYKLEYFHTFSESHELVVSSFVYDKKNGSLWMGTISNGIFHYNIKDKVFAKASFTNFPDQPVLVLKENTPSTILAGIDGQGIWELSKDGKTVLNIFKEDENDPFSLWGDGVYDLFCDENDRVWVATFTGGLSFFDKKPLTVTHISHQINNVNSLVNNQVNKVLEDHKRNIWFATNNGISRWNPISNRWESYFNNDSNQSKVFLGLCEDKNGNIWAGSYSSGIYILDGNTGKEISHLFSKTNSGRILKKFVNDIYRDSEGDIWIGGPNYVTCYHADEKRFQDYDQQPVYAFAEFSPGKILLGCTYGLLSLDKNTGIIELLVDNCMVQDICVVDNNIWIATSGEGLLEYNYESKSLITHTIESGLTTNYLNSLILKDDYLWIGTEKGLCQLDIKKNLINRYSGSHLLSSLSFNTNSCWSLQDNKLIWGTNRGVIMYDPDNLLSQNKVNGRIFFQDIIISGQSIREKETLLNNTAVDVQKELVLDYKQNNFVLEILPVETNSASTKYSWMLDGFDSDWVHLTDFNYITYTNLPAGNYELKIRMYDASMSQVIDQRSISISVTPPFWNTWWFYLLCFAMIAGIVFYAFKTYTNQLKQKHTKDKIRFFTNMAHDIRTSLTLIQAPIEQLHKAPELTIDSQYYIGLAAEQSRKLSSVATQLLDFEKVDSGKGQLYLIHADVVKLIENRIEIFEATAIKKNIKLSFMKDKEQYITSLDVVKIEKVIDNLLSNAIKYSHPNSKVDITLTCEKNEWKLEVKDYGLGISNYAKNKLFKEFYREDNPANSKIAGTGIGLLLVKSYVKIHGGKVFMQSKKNEGTAFTIVIPGKEIMDVTLCDQTERTNEEHDSLYENDFVKQEKKLKKLNLLLVEDNCDLQEFLTHALSGQYNVWKAKDGTEALEIIKKKAPDLIISDIIMPNMNGFKLCKLVKSSFETSHIPLILLTSLTEKAKQLEGLGLGADDYITKPFDITIFIQRIDSMLRNREIVKERALRFTIQDEKDQTFFSNKLNDKFVKKAMEVITQNMSNTEFDKDEFASAMYVSPSLLYQKIKSLTGQSPIELIKTIRFRYSIELLHTHKYSIAEISEMCGFSSPSYFTTSFKRFYGKPPTDFLN